MNILIQFIENQTISQIYGAKCIFTSEIEEIRKYEIAINVKTADFNA